MANQVSINAVTDQALQTLRESGRNRAGDSELLIFLLANEPSAIVHRDPDPMIVQSVGATTVPETAMPHQNAAAFHLRRDGIDVGISILGPARVFVAERNDAGCAVRFSEISQGPHAVANDRRVRSCQADHLIIGMNRLRRFPSTNADRGEGGDQAAIIEDPFDHRENDRMDWQSRIGFAMSEQIVDPKGLVSFEIVLGRGNILQTLDAEQILTQFVEELFADHGLEDRVALFLDFMECPDQGIFTERNFFHLAERITPAASCIISVARTRRAETDDTQRSVLDISEEQPTLRPIRGGGESE